VTDTTRDAEQNLSEGQRSATTQDVVSPARRVPTRRYQVSLRFLFVAVAIVAAGFAFVRAKIQEVADERHAVDAMRALGAGVVYETPEEAGAGTVERLGRMLEARVDGRNSEFPRVVEVHFYPYADPSMDAHPCFITPGDLVHLKSTPHVRRLRLYQQSRITDSALTHLAALAGLEDLDLSGTAVTDDAFKYLAHIKDLKHIGLSDTSVTDATIADLPHWSMLRGVTLDGTKISDGGLIHLGKLTQLELLYLTGAKITDNGLIHLQELTQLKFLCLNGTQITDDGLVHLGKLTRLEHLHLNGTQVTDVGLAHLRQLANLRHLHLYKTLVTDEGLSSLATMPKLKGLAVRGTSVTEAGCNRLQQSLPGLKIRR
jgi:Leucine-rich repeat (LRR) protein